MDIGDAANFIVATRNDHQAAYDLLVALIGVNEGLERQNNGLRAVNAKLVAKLELKARIAEECIKNRAEKRPMVS